MRIAAPVLATVAGVILLTGCASSTPEPSPSAPTNPPASPAPSFDASTAAFCTDLQTLIDEGMKSGKVSASDTEAVVKSAPANQRGNVTIYLSAFRQYLKTQDEKITTDPKVQQVAMEVTKTCLPYQPTTAPATPPSN